jgi:hypothetical protein
VLGTIVAEFGDEVSPARGWVPEKNGMLPSAGRPGRHLGISIPGAPSGADGRWVGRSPEA